MSRSEIERYRATLEAKKTKLSVSFRQACVAGPVQKQ